MRGHGDRVAGMFREYREGFRDYINAYSWYGSLSTMN